MKNQNITFGIILFVLACVALLPQVHAVSPPPDGGYAGFNTAEGTNALESLSTGVGNAAVGWYSLSSNTDGSYNTALGAGTLLFNIGDQSALEGINNTAVGAAALLFNTTGAYNTAVGVLALVNNDSGVLNTAVGFGTLQENTTGSQNTAVGMSALQNNTTGNSNTATGQGALANNADGQGNTANGQAALNDNTGDYNTANGLSALSFNTTGEFNSASGTFALQNNTTGSNNTALGRAAGLNVTTADNVICIGANIAGSNVNDSCYIGSIFGQTSASGVPVLVNSSHKLGTSTSSKRFKEGIKRMEEASETLFDLKPVTFRYKKDIDPQGTSQFGLVAEEVEKINPDLVVRDRDGKPYSVRYDQINAMLLNEFLKEHRKVQELETTVAQQQKRIEVLATCLEKVSAKIELSQGAPQVVATKP